MKKNIGLLMIAFLVAIANLNAQDKTEADSNLLGLPGDNLDLYAVLDLFQESKTIEAFEESLNDEKKGINNLDLNLDDEVDFIKVETKQEKNDFAFVLQVDVLKGEIQDVAVILVSKDDAEKVTIQIVGDESLYGKDYVIEPKSETEAVTANPGYSGTDTVVVKSEPSTVVVVESEPIVHYVYSPVYVPYHPPYYYGYCPPYYHPYPVISINIYFGRNRHHHNHYHGGHNNRGGNTVVINNNNKTYNNYSKTRNTSNTVARNKSDGNYKRNDASNRASNGAKNINNKSVPDSKKNATKNNVKDNKTSVPSNKSNVKPATKPSNKPTTRPANKPSGKSKGGGKRR
ncbi:MAG: hypothetical protein L3J34_10725 [Flavobacteriaceae bacterium]|nr:hypothetical protein [Flavobacteriaceae bacterium]